MAAIREIVRSQLLLEGEVETGDRLLADLDLDSVERMTLAIELEDRFGVSLTSAPMGSLRTVGDVCRFIARRSGVPR